MDLGQNQRGVDMDPNALRCTHLQGQLECLGHTVLDEGNLHVPNPEENVAEGQGRRLKTVTAVYQNIYDVATQCIEHGDFALFFVDGNLGG